MRDKSYLTRDGSLFKRIILFSLPIMLSSMLQLIYNSADLVIVGRFAGDAALASVGSTTSLIHLIINIFLGLSIGVNISAAFSIGAGDERSASEVSHTALCLGFIMGVLLAVVGYFASPLLLEMMGTPHEEGVFDGAVLYMRIYFIGMPASLVYNYCAAVLKALGDTTRPFFYLLFSGIVNIILNLIFVIVFDMSVAGVAIATVISQVISAVLVVIQLFREDSCCRLYWSRLRITGSKLKRILLLGIPAGIQSTMFSMSNVFFQSAVNTFDVATISGNSAASTVEGITWNAVYSFQDAGVTFTSAHLGAKKYEKLKSIFFVTCTLAMSMGLLFGIPMLLAREFMVSLFTPDSYRAIAAGASRLAVTMPSYFLGGLMTAASGCTRGLGKSIPPTVIAILGVCGVRILWLFTVFGHFGTLTSLYLSYPVSWSIAFIGYTVTFFLSLSVIKKRKREISLS